MRKVLSLSLLFIAAFFVLNGVILEAQVNDFENYTIGDTLNSIGWSEADLDAVVEGDTVAAGNNSLKVLVHNYNAAPVIELVLPSGSILSDYDSLSFKGYFAQGDVGYKDIIVEGYADMPTGVFNNGEADVELGSWNRAQGVSSDWEDIKIDIANSSSLSDTVYIAMGIHASGSSNGATTTYFLDDIELMEMDTPPDVPTKESYDFEEYAIGDTLPSIGWAPTDLDAVVEGDTVASGNNSLKVAVHNYNAAPVLEFVLPEGNSIADYDSLSFKGYFAQGDVGWKDIVVEGYADMPTGTFSNGEAEVELGSWNRAQGVSSDWEDISINITSDSSLTDTVYIAFGINASGSSDGATTTYFVDDVQLLQGEEEQDTTITPEPPVVDYETNPNGDFEESSVTVGDDTSGVLGWSFQVGDHAKCQIVDDTVQSGNRALKIKVNSTGSNAWDVQAVNEMFAIESGVKYTVTAWLRTDSISGGVFDYTAGDPSFNEYGRKSGLSLSTDWKMYTLEFTPGAGKDSARIPLHFSMSENVGKTIYVDNVIVSRPPTKKPIIVEAEQAQSLGNEFTVDSTDNLGFISISTDYDETTGTGDYPGENRTASYQVPFPEGGNYDLFARIRVGADGFNDDSFFYGNGFGPKDPGSADDWIMANGFASAGFANSNDIVRGPGSLGNEVWKWVNLSRNIYQSEDSLTFTIGNDSLNRIFQIGARENGLDIDKFAFGHSELYFTVQNLNEVTAGYTESPKEEDTITYEPIAKGKDKFLGNIYSSAQMEDFTQYWTQVTPENAGKWGSVEGTRDDMNWSGLDAAVELANQTPDSLFRFHVLVWGAQQPGWITDLSEEEQLAEIEEWFQAVADRYGEDIDYLEVVNEPLPGHNQPPYKNALGGDGETGWDWIITAFQMARDIFPDHVKLMINEYGILSSSGDGNSTYMEIINLLNERGLIDAIGCQGHSFSIKTTPISRITSNINSLGSTGLPVQITEMDINESDDQLQKAKYQEIFPAIWENDAVMGVTLWGWRPGTWQEDAYLIDNSGNERPALEWMRAYVDTATTATAVEDNFANNGLPTEFKIYDNYPNPFNPNTKIIYDVPSHSKVKLQVFDINGRLVQTLVDGVKERGQYSLTFSADQLSTGIYFYRIQAGEYTKVKKMMLVK